MQIALEPSCRYNLRVSYTKKVAYNTVAQFVGKGIGIAISLVTVAVLFRYLGVDGVGKYTTSFAFVAFAAIFADFGLGWTLLRELSVEKDQNRVFKNIFAFRTILALAVHIAAIGVIWLFNYTSDIKIAVGVLSIAWIFQTLNSTVVSVFIQNYRLDISVIAEVVGRVIVLALIYCMAYLNAGLPYIMGTYFVGNAVNFFINLHYANKFVDVGFAYDKKYWKYFIRQAFPIGLVLVFSYVYYKIDSLMLSLMKGMTDVGIYGTPYKLLEVLQTFPGLFLGATFPLVTRYIVKNDERMYSSFQKQFDFLALLAVPIVSLCFVLASPIISFIAGSRGAEFITTSTVTFAGTSMTSVTCLRILIFSVGVSFISNLYNFTIVSLGKQKKMIIPTLCFAIFNIVLNLILIPKISYIGASLATLATEIVLLITVYTIVNKTIRFKVKLGSFAKIIVSGIVCAASASAMYGAGLNFILSGLFSAFLYIILVIALKAVPIDLVRAVISRKNEDSN